ncbi:MAG TPA: type IV pilus secretin PilQ [Thiolinea sp.]|nr:type IV pilus secretin PilQ [Thiolinea sp.]
MTWAIQVLAAPRQLENISINAASTGKTEVHLSFNTPVQIPKGFVLNNPARLVFDFPGIEVAPAARNNATHSGVVKSVKAAGNKGQTRLVIDMDRLVNYSAEVQGSDLILMFDAPAQGGVSQPAPKVRNVQPQTAGTGRIDDSYLWYKNPGQANPATQPAPPKVVNRPVPVVVPKPVPRPTYVNTQPRPAPVLPEVPPPTAVTRPVQPRPSPYVAPAPARQQPVQRQLGQGQQQSVNALRSVDFRREANGGGRIIITLPNANVQVSDEKRSNVLNLVLQGVDVPGQWQKRLDVTDFATPVSGIQISQRSGSGRIVINASKDFTYRTERNRNILTVFVDEARKKPEKRRPGEQEKKVFNGEKLSLNFQDIEVRAVLQLLADFTDKNIVVSDSVNGNITVRLKDVPWDQALDIVLQSKNLGMRANGSVIWVAPQAELEAKDAKALELAKQKEELEPLITEYIPINYAKAADLAQLIKTRSATAADEASHSLLSKRGNVSFDERTNTLLVQDTAEQVAEIRDLIKVLDVPVQQVLIESRIVIANDEFGKELGTKFGVTPRWSNRDSVGIGTGHIAGTSGYFSSAADAATSTTAQTITMPSLNDRLSVNLPVTGAAGSFGFSILSSDFMLDLELSALQAESKGEIVATPRVITSNQTKALIEQGVEVPYQEASSSGATSVSFKKAVLSLEVTPQITPDEHISMDLRVNQDTVGQIYANVPSIDTREIQTKVLVENGQTIVLGGVHEENRIDGVTKVPVLGDLPVVGKLFQKTNKSESKRELLIFVTPTIVDSKTAGL